MQNVKMQQTDDESLTSGKNSPRQQQNGCEIYTTVTWSLGLDRLYTHQQYT
eukprot:gene6699-13584_t